MGAEIEAPKPRTFGALLFVPGATLRNKVEMLEQPLSWRWND
jgi:hypothetical protein